MSQVPAENTASRRIAWGAFLGLVWGASLRAWMSMLALQLGDRPTITWVGTFAGILLPATLVGVLVGLAVYVAETSSRERWRWVLLSPLILILGPATTNPGFLSTLLATGMGGGAIGVALVGMLGGYAISGVGPRWTRTSCGFLAVLFGLASIVPSYMAGRSLATPPRAGEAFGGLLFILLMVVLVAAISAPSRVRTCRSTHVVPPDLAA
jgi:hypothetical protein